MHGIALAWNVMQVFCRKKTGMYKRTCLLRFNIHSYTPLINRSNTCGSNRSLYSVSEKFPLKSAQS